MKEMWKFYNGAFIPTCAPHEIVDETEIINGTIWKKNKRAFFARWTTDFDCKGETNWWYTIQDVPFEIEKAKSKVRYNIRKGLKNFDCRRIEPRQYAEEMAYITLEDWKTYPESYRPNTSKEELIKEFSEWNYITHGAFDKETGKLCAFHGIRDAGNYYEMIQGKSLPEMQKKRVNQALIYTYIMDISSEYTKGKYLSNGQRNLNHQTNFNEDLVNMYGFRKAYCKLHVKYRPCIYLIVKILYPFRKVITRLDRISLFHKIQVVLKMEEILRNY